MSGTVFTDDERPENFRKELGIINRRLAKISDTVVECAYGNIIFGCEKSSERTGAGGMDD